MTKTRLSTDWHLAAAHEVSHTDIQNVDLDCANWMSVTVPSTVQSALVESGRAPSPWRDCNAKAFERYENDTWLYRTVFDVPKEDAKSDRFELQFDGVSLFATVWLNGSPVGFTDNAHRRYRFDVTRQIDRSGPNVLVVECELRIDEMRKRIRDDIGATSDRVRSYVRLCQMSFGWDFAPRLLPTGLWRPASLLCHRGASIGDLAVRTESVTNGVANLSILVEARSVSDSGQPSTLRLAANDDDGETVWKDERTFASDVPVTVEAIVENAKLWYPNGMGSQHLHTVEAEIEQNGEITDHRSQRFGIRTVELKRDGQFTFCVNGIDVFARGANWVPPDTLNLDTTPEKYRHLLERARDAHFNMLRVWGGGTYENDTFYDLCDELGIMVWQDFMFACGMYPDDDPTFMENVAQEATDAVRRLRSHPCVVLWCGENECQDTWAGGYEWYKNADRHYGARIYEHVLPDAVTELSPDIPWWPGSPFGGAATMSLTEGDFHDWYDLPNWRKYDEHAPRFSSEYGFRSVSQQETVDAMISPQFQWDRAGFLHHTWDFHHGVCNWMKGVLPEFGEPKTLGDFIMLSQEAQATLMRYAVESYRRKTFGTSGSLIWQYNEPWPAVTFSLVDYFGRPKAAYYWVARAYAPMIGLFYGDETNPEYWGVTDSMTAQNGVLRLRRFGHDGTLLGDASVDVSLHPNAATQLLSEIPSELRIGSPENELIHSELRCDDMVSERVHHAAVRKDWKFVQADVCAKVERGDNGAVRLALESDVYVHFLFVRCADEWARFSDNYFDLVPGVAKTIEIQSCRDEFLTIEAANVAPFRVDV